MLIEKFYDSIELHQEKRKNKSFKIVYGLQVKENLNYSEATTELGACIFHHLACESKLNNDVN